MNNIEINGKTFTTEEIEQLLANAKDPMNEVYAFHGTTKEAFDALYASIPHHIKAYAQEEMICNWYNNGQDLLWDGEQKIWMLWTNNTQENPVFFVSGFYCSFSLCSPRLGFLEESHGEAAFERFREVYNLSRSKRKTTKA